MNVELMALIVAWGAILASAYSAALWWTVRRLPTVPHPALWTVGSFYLRLAVLGLGFYVAGAGSLARLAAAFAGFLLTRLLILRKIRPSAGTGPELAKGADE